MDNEELTAILRELTEAAVSIAKDVQVIALAFQELKEREMDAFNAAND